MDGEGEDFTLRWEESPIAKREMIEDTDQIAAENLMFLSQDVVNYAEQEDLECITEEIITDDWTGGQERVEVPLDQFANQALDCKNEDDIDVPLPTDQDEYTAMRPWPCDFCSRRFRKKAALMNHMVAHQNDRPHGCNLCGMRYVRKCDLMNHLKTHAYVPDHPDDVEYEELLEDSQTVRPKKKRGRRRKERKQSNNGVWENMTSARTQQWQRRARSPKPPPIPSPSLSPSPSPESPPPAPADPSRPFVCKHCGVGFAREKALQSHSRIHGGDSPVECRACGELCWSREALATHTRTKHPNLPSAAPAQEFTDSDNSDGDIDYQLSPTEDSTERVYEPVYDSNSKGPELFCQDCGVAFQRADLLRRHVAAAHSYKRHDSSSSTWAEHTCDVCGETCTDALQLLAHAELHAERPRASTTNRIKKTPRGRGSSISSSSSRHFPCNECGKVFGSRSSQQIHVRIHTGERPYACRFCWKAFADGGTLRKHERIHTGEKPYACAVCPRAFNQRVVLREHIRSHHSAPDRRTNGTPMYACAVCGRQLHSSSDLVQHLIQHSDANTAMKRQPQGGPRKYKRRRKLKSESVSDTADTDPLTRDEAPLPRSRSPSPPSPVLVEPVPTVSKKRRPQKVPPPRPKMIHVEDPRKSKQALRSRPPRHPADDLRAIQSQPSRRDPTPPRVKAEVQPEIPQIEPDTGGPYKCEMCWEEFDRRDDLLLHVPIHI